MKLNIAFLKFTKKKYIENYVKYMKYYDREKNYDIEDNKYYKGYDVKWKKNSRKIEFFPIDNNSNSNSNTENSSNATLVWLYDGDWPEYFIHSLLEHNNFPPKVKIFFKL